MPERFIIGFPPVFFRIESTTPAGNRNFTLREAADSLTLPLVRVFLRATTPALGTYEISTIEEIRDHQTARQWQVRRRCAGQSRHQARRREAVCRHKARKIRGDGQTGNETTRGQTGSHRQA